MRYLRSSILVLCGVRLLLAMPPKCDEDDIFLQVRRKGLKGGGGRRAYRRNIDLENCVILDLDMLQPPLKEQGALRLAAALKAVNATEDGTTLREIRLRGNNIQDEGAAAIAEALHNHTNLEVLDLWANFIDDDGIAALCKALAECCPHVRKLKLRMNPVGTLSAKWLIWLLHYNPELVELDVDRADLGTLYDDIGHIVELMPHEREALETLPPPDAQDPGRDSKEGPKKAQEAVKKNRDYDTSNLPEWALKEKRIADAGEAGDQAKVQEILDEYNKKDAATYEDKLQQRAERAAQRAVERARAAGELPAPDTVTTPLELPDLTPEARRATRELIKSEL